LPLRYSMSRVSLLARRCAVAAAIGIFFLLLGPVFALFGFAAGFPIAYLLEIGQVFVKTTRIARGRFSSRVRSFELLIASLCLSAFVSQTGDGALKSRIANGLPAVSQRGRGPRRQTLYGLEFDPKETGIRLLAMHSISCAEAIVVQRRAIDHVKIVDGLRERIPRQSQIAVFTAAFSIANGEGLEMAALRVLTGFALGFGIRPGEFKQLLFAHFMLDAVACSILGLPRVAEMPAIEHAYRARSDRTLEEDELARVAYHKLMDQLIALDEVVADYENAYGTSAIRS